MLVSIVTPSFKQLKWLKLCAASIADQEGPAHEHIVQDAGTGPQLESWANSVPEMKLFVEKDNGMYDAINRGLRRARGDILAYLNCDEQYLPNVLAQVVSFFAENPEVKVLFGDSILVDINGKPLSYRRTVLPTLSHVHHVQLNAPTCSMFFRRALIDRGFLFDPQLKIIGDQVWVEELLRSNVKMGVLNQPLAVFTFTGENLSSGVAAEEEAIQRRGRLSLLGKLQNAGRVIWYRIRKLFAGAYWIRELDVAIYTLDAPATRQRKRAKVGFFWRES